MTRRLCLVTGASAGIGAAFARLYAAKGYDLALTARRADRLETLAAELRERHEVTVTVLPADLAEPAVGTKILAALASVGGKVDVLINNAGYGLPGAYAATHWSDQQRFLQVMLIAVCDLTHHALPGMIDRGYGRIINVASLAGLIPGGPGHTLYGASKSFLMRFSQSLNQETRDTGVHVSALCPGFTVSEFHDANGTREQVRKGVPRWAWLSADAVAAAGYAAVEGNRAVCVPGAANRIAATLTRIIPDPWVSAMMARESGRYRRV